MSSDAVFEAAHVSPEDGSYNEGQSGASGASDSLSVSVSVSAPQQQLRSPAPGAVVGPAARVGVLMGRQLKGEQPLTAAEMLELQRQHTLRTAAEFGYLHPAATPGGNASVLVGAGVGGGGSRSSSSSQQAPPPAVAVGASASAGGSATKFQFEPAASTSSSGAGARAAGHQRDEVELVIMPTLGSGSRKLRLTSYEDRVRSVSLGSAAEAGTSGALATRAPLAEPPTSGSAKIPQNMLSQYRTVSAPSGPTVVRAGDALAAAAGGGCSSPAPAADTDTNNPRFLKQRFLQGYTMDVPQQFTFEVSVEAPVVPEGAGAPAGSRPETLTDLAPAGRCEDEEQGQTTVENHVDLDTELDAGAFWHPSATSPRYDSQTRPTNRDRADQQLASTKVEVGSSSTSDISGSMMQLGGGPAAPVSGPAASASSTREENQEDFQTLAGSGVVNVNVNQDVVAPATSLSTGTAGASSSTLGSRSQSTRAGAPAETTSLSSADKQRSKGSSASSSSATGGPQNQNHAKRGSSKTGGFFGGLFSSFASKFSSSTTASAATTTTNTKTATAEIKVVRTTGDGANKKQLWASREQEEAVLVDTTAGAAARSSRAVQPLPESGSPPLRVEDRPPELRTSGEGAASVEPRIEGTKGALVITTSEVSAEGGSADKNNFDFPDHSGDEPIFSPASETSGTSSQQKVHPNETAKLPAGGSPAEDLSVSASLEMPAIPSPDFSTLSQSSVMSPLTYGGLEQKMQAGSMYARAQHQDQPPPTILDLQKLSFAPPQTAGFAPQASLIATTSPPCTATTPSPHTTANSFAPSIFAPAPRTAQIPQTRFDLVMQEQGGLGSMAAGPRPPAQGAAPDGAPFGASSPGGQSVAGSTAKVKANIFSRPAATTGGRAAPKQLSSPPAAPKSSASSSPSPSPLRRGPGDENSLPTTSTIINGGPSRPSQQGRSSPNSSKENYKAQPQTIIARLVLAEEFEPQLVLDENSGAKSTGVVRLHCPESSMSMMLLDGGRLLGGGDEKPDELPAEAVAVERETPLWSAPLDLPLRFLNLGMYDLDYSPSPGAGASSNRGGASPVLAATRNANPTGKIGNKNIPRKRQVSEQALVRCPLGTYEHLPKLKIQSRGSSGRVGFVDRDVNVGAEGGGGAEMGRGIFDYHVYFEADAIAEQEPGGETVRLFLDCRCWLEGEVEVWKTDVAGASYERNGLANFISAGDHLQEEEEVVE